MKNKNLLIVAVVLGVGYLWWKNKKATESSKGTEASTSGSEGEGVSKGRPVLGGVPRPKPIPLEPVLGGVPRPKPTFEGVTFQGRPVLGGVPRPKPTPLEPVLGGVPRLRPTFEGVRPTISTASENTTASSQFLTFDGKYDRNSAHWFDGNLD